MKTLSLGLIAHFTDAAGLADACRRTLDEIDPNPENATLTVRAMMKRLNQSAPPFAYVGHHPSEYFDFGVWIDLSQLHAAERSGKLAQVMGGSWKGIKSPYVLALNPEGKLTLYRRRGRKEVWSVS